MSLHSNAVVDFFRCPESAVKLSVDSELSSDLGYFRFGQNIRCYGQYLKPSTGIVAGEVPDLSQQVVSDRTTVRLPFDPSQIVENFRRERYVGNGSARGKSILASEAIRKLYYTFRPLLGIPMRKHLQRLALRNWEALPFPYWPVDTSVEKMLEGLLALSMRAQGIETIPFIWFWPEGASSCAIVTHDVESRAGVSFTRQLMDLDDVFGIKGSFQVVPEGPYAVSADYLDAIRSRGFEINIQDLHHSSNLFADRHQFLVDAQSINRYAREYRAEGFRSGRLYRNADWLGVLGISYDMSVPNVAHLESQRGGCCTVFPYFIDQILELPVTMVEDYSLFHVLGDYSTELWKRQMALVMQQHGLMSFIIHPDYVNKPNAQRVYEGLLQYLALLRTDENLWIALPGEVNQWWRERNSLILVEQAGQWQIVGPGKERARIAYAKLDGDNLTYSFDSNHGRWATTQSPSAASVASEARE